MIHLLLSVKPPVGNNTKRQAPARIKNTAYFIFEGSYTRTGHNNRAMGGDRGQAQTHTNTQRIDYAAEVGKQRTGTFGDPTCDSGIYKHGQKYGTGMAASVEPT